MAGSNKEETRSGGRRWDWVGRRHGARRGQAWHEEKTCQVHKPRVPRGPASTPGLGPKKQHAVHGPAQKSRIQWVRRTVRSPTERPTRKGKHSLINFFGAPLRPERSLRAPTASRRSLRLDGLDQKCRLLLRPRGSDRGPVGSLRTALL